MPLVAGAPVLAIACGAAAGCTEPIGFASWVPVAAAICAGLTTFCGVFNPLAGTPMIAIGAAATPGGSFVATPAIPFGLLLAAASLSLDAAGIKKWTNVAGVLITWMSQYAKYSGLGLIAWSLPGPGPVTGIGTISFSNEVIGPTLATAAGIMPGDASGLAHWTAVGTAILTVVKTFGLITPTAMIDTAGAGPISGAGALS